MLIEKLSEKDLEITESYIRTYGPNYGAEVWRSPKHIEHLLRFWDKAKSKYLWELMGGQFILEQRVEYCEATQKIRDNIIQSYEFGDMKDFRRHFNNYLNNRYSRWYDSEYSVLRGLMDSNNLAANSMLNTIHEDTVYTIEFENGQKIKIDRNTKPIRALGKIAKILNLEESFEKFRLKHSLLLNNKKLSGDLCLSIHPLDYLTMSENVSKWTSCMNWHEPGSYRMGTVEMMNSEMVVIAYLKSDNSELEWNGDKWNDKRWRLLIVVSPEGIVSIKGYPYYHPELTKKCVQWLSDLAAQNLGWSYDEIAEVPDMSTFDYVDGNYYYMDSNAGTMYNDFGSTTHWGCFPKRLGVDSSPEDPYRVVFNYSGETECMCCGEVVNVEDLYDESYVYCCNCTSNVDESGETCANCGCWWDRDDMYWVDDDYVCPDCIDNVAAECVIDSEWHWNENLATVYLARKTDTPNPDNDNMIYIYDAYTHRWDMRPSTNNRILIPYPRYDDENDVWYLNSTDITLDGMKWYFRMSHSETQNYFE